MPYNSTCKGNSTSSYLFLLLDFVLPNLQESFHFHIVIRLFRSVLFHDDPYDSDRQSNGPGNVRPWRVAETASKSCTVPEH